MQPRLKRSVRASIGLSLTCSGDMKSVVPTTMPSSVSKTLPACPAIPTSSPNPRSSTFTIPVLDEEQVRGLDIAVDHPLLVRVGEAPRGLRHVVDDLIRRQRPAAREDVFQVVPFQVLHDDVRTALMHVGIDGPDHIGVVEERDDLHLAEEPGDRRLRSAHRRARTP